MKAEVRELAGQVYLTTRYTLRRSTPSRRSSAADCPMRPSSSVGEVVQSETLRPPSAVRRDEFWIDHGLRNCRRWDLFVCFGEYIPPGKSTHMFVLPQCLCYMGNTGLGILGHTPTST